MRFGCAFAQSFISGRTLGKQRFELARKAIEQKDRDGFYYLASCHENSYGCEADMEEAKVNYMHAVAQGFW